MELRTEIYKILEAARDDIRGNMAAAGINASGRTSASIHVRDTADGVQLVGGGENAAPVPTLEVGRPGGKVPRGFYYIIKEWSKAKGIQFEKESERSTFAYFVAKKIAREGTQRNKENVDVYSTPVKKAVGSINEVVGRFARTEIAGIVRTSLTTTNTPLHF